MREGNKCINLILPRLSLNLIAVKNFFLINNIVCMYAYMSVDVNVPYTNINLWSNFASNFVHMVLAVREEKLLVKYTTTTPRGEGVVGY